MKQVEGALSDIFIDAGLTPDGRIRGAPETEPIVLTDDNGGKRNTHRANDLDGKTWTKHSISIWSDIRKSQEEIALAHPAMFPSMLPARLIEMFTSKCATVLDPFLGTGSTLLAARQLDRNGIGIELSKEYSKIAQKRLNQSGLFEHGGFISVIHCADAHELAKFVEPESIDLVVTSPPYWDILTEKRTADYKEIRNYGDDKRDLGRIKGYRDFISALQGIFQKVHLTLKEGGYCCIIVMDIRKKSKFYPFHSDLAGSLEEVGFELDDVIIWDRRQEYNNLRPLGYPAVFRVNKVHEFIVIMRKPKIGR